MDWLRIAFRLNPIILGPSIIFLAVGLVLIATRTCDVLEDTSTAPHSAASADSLVYGKQVATAVGPVATALTGWNASVWRDPEGRLTPEDSAPQRAQQLIREGLALATKVYQAISAAEAKLKLLDPPRACEEYHQLLREFLALEREGFLEMKSVFETSQKSGTFQVEKWNSAQGLFERGVQARERLTSALQQCR